MRELNNRGKKEHGKLATATTDTRNYLEQAFHSIPALHILLLLQSALRFFPRKSFPTEINCTGESKCQHAIPFHLSIVSFATSSIFSVPVSKLPHMETHFDIENYNFYYLALVKLCECMYAYCMFFFFLPPPPPPFIPERFPWTQNQFFSLSLFLSSCLPFDFPPSQLSRRIPSLRA